jgi:hypothetical protein
MSADDPEDPDDLDKIRAKFFDNIAEFEAAEPRALFDVLSEGGLELPHPEAMDDAQLTGKLWEVIHGLALAGTFLHNTDHLSDRELYAELWSDLLREPATLFPDNPDYAYHIDMIGSGSEEHIHLHLKYYASEEERRSWLEDWPEDVMPDREEPPHDRDRRLPTREGRKDSPVM